MARRKKQDAHLSAVKTIKRYGNRKLYDTHQSRYVTLEEISRMVRSGEEIRVIDNKTQEDLTSVTLAQIMLEEVSRHLSGPTKLTDVYFVLFDEYACSTFRRVHEQMAGGTQ